MSTLYETPPQATAADLIEQEERFSISEPIPSIFTLSATPALDADGDPLVEINLNGWSATRGDDYTLNGAVITWSSPVNLEAGEVLRVRYQPAP